MPDAEQRPMSGTRPFRHKVQLVQAWRCVDCGELFYPGWPHDAVPCPAHREVREMHTDPTASDALAALTEDEFDQLLAETRCQARAAGYLLVAPTEPPDDPSPRLGWWVVKGASLLSMLRRAHAGETPDLIYAEEYANSDHDGVPGA